jgi:ribosome maturation protein SDO1
MNHPFLPPLSLSVFVSHSLSLTLSLQEILEKGDLQVTELERQALIEGMFRDVATIVTDKSVNPETDRPYTISMIQNAMKDIHYSVSLNKNAKQQALDVIRRLRKVMPIARVLMSLKITLALSCESSHILGRSDS